VLRRVAGSGSAAIAVPFVVQLNSAVSDANAAGATSTNLVSILGWGVPVAVAAGLVLALTKPENETG
jgi:hypothetical protein